MACAMARYAAIYAATRVGFAAAVVFFHYAQRGAAATLPRATPRIFMPLRVAQAVVFRV